MGFFDRIKQSLTKTTKQFVERFDEVVRRADAPEQRSRPVDVETIDALEEALISADVGVAATERVLARSGMKIDDLDRFEVNEAFASVVLSWLGEHRPDPEKVNANGGAIALGHPVGSTGARLLTSALHELERVDGTTALVTMCAGGAMATATILERV